MQVVEHASVQFNWDVTGLKAVQLYMQVVEQLLVQFVVMVVVQFPVLLDTTDTEVNDDVLVVFVVED
jgi:hypothetical protein